jgi:hypothetical protein
MQVVSLLLLHTAWLVVLLVAGWNWVLLTAD